MATISVIDANNQIKDLRLLAEHEPVTIECDGVPKFQLISTDHYITVPVEEYTRLKPPRCAPRFGFAKEQLKGLAPFLPNSVDRVTS